MKKPTLLLLFFSILLYQCQLLDMERESSKLPPITTNGANTFGARINGKNISVNISSRLRAEYRRSGFFSVSATYRNIRQDIDQYIQIKISGEEVDVGTYEISSSSTDTREIVFHDDTSDCFYDKRLNSSTEYEGILEIIHLDEQAKIISGTFSFTIKVEDCPDVAVALGRFDIRY